MILKIYPYREEVKIYLITSKNVDVKHTQLFVYYKKKLKK